MFVRANYTNGTMLTRTCCSSIVAVWAESRAFCSVLRPAAVMSRVAVEGRLSCFPASVGIACSTFRGSSSLAEEGRSSSGAVGVACFSGIVVGEGEMLAVKEIVSVCSVELMLATCGIIELSVGRGRGREEVACCV